MASSPSPAFRMNGGAASMGSVNGDDGGGCLRGCEREGRCDGSEMEKEMIWMEDDGWEDDEREMGSGKEILFRSLAARRRRQYCEDEEDAPEGGARTRGGAVTMLSTETGL
ncbi:hypothetical protein MRB53_023163 [Persea americana]|uniref:Uncharacterized protein n=1 Tax=Persea americana TaxID=3435 RepID=A0ACC2L9A2_PERAE|nr:hypothetical protein MRB53_023163 [Persea americana]